MITSQSMKEFCLNNPKLVLVKETSKPNLFVLKYNRRVFYDNLWNDYLEQCRGTIVDENYNVVSIPFTKIYNFRVEDKAPDISDSTIVNCYRKVNGFMGAITVHNNELLISTTGSIDSDFCQYIRDLINYDHYFSVLKQYPDQTFLFEVVHPSDPHIIPEQTGMYLLGSRTKAWNSSLNVNPTYLSNLANQLNCFVPEHKTTTVGNIVAETKTVKHEGFVFYTSDGLAAKTKSKYYLVSKAIARKQSILSLNKQNIDEEYYPLIDFLKNSQESFDALPEQERLNVIRQFLETT